MFLKNDGDPSIQNFLTIVSISFAFPISKKKKKNLFILVERMGGSVGFFVGKAIRRETF